MNDKMAWAVLLIAGLCEIAWAVGLKYSDGFTRLWPSMFSALFMVASVALLGWSLKSLPLGTAYAVWTGVGALGTALVGILLFGESREPMRLASMALILIGIVGVKLATPDSLPESAQPALLAKEPER